MPRIIEGIDREVPGKLGDDLLENIQLRPQGMKQHQRRAFAIGDVTKSVAVNFNMFDGNVRRPGQLLGRNRLGTQRLHHMGNQNRRHRQ